MYRFCAQSLLLLTLLLGAAPPEWGTAQDGLQCGVDLLAPPAMRGGFRVGVWLRNEGDAAVPLGPAAGVFCWIFVAQGEQASWYSERLPLAERLDAWPQTLAPGAAIAFPPIDVGPRNVYPYVRGLRIANGYPRGVGDALPAGALHEQLRPEEVRVRAMFYLPRPEHGPRLLVSNTVVRDVSGPDLEAMTPAEREAYVATLMTRFRTSAWSAKQAHAVAASIGPAIGPALLATAQEPDLSPESRMWLATALTDVGYQPAVPLLVDFLAERPALRPVIAYHGPKLRSEELNAAIEKAARASGTDVAVWAFRGLVIHRGQPSTEFQQWALSGEDPKLRAAAIMTLARQATTGSIDRLVQLLGDDDARVAAAAAHGLAESGKARRDAIAGLLLALDRESDGLRQAATRALGTLTGREAVYEPEADEATRAGVLAGWKQWWLDHADDFSQR